MTDIAEQRWRFCFCSRSAAEVKSLEAQVNRQEHALILANAGLKELHERNERLREALLEIDRNCCGVPGGFSGKILDVARAALEQKP